MRALAVSHKQSAEHTYTAHGKPIHISTGISVDLLNDFLSYLDVSENTVKTYQRGLKRFFTYIYEQGLLQPVRSDIQSFRRMLETEGLKASTIQLYIVSVRRFFEWTEAQGLYPNISKGIKGARVSNEHKKDYLTAEQLQHVLRLIDTTTEQGIRNYAMLSLMATTGLRTVEVSRARIENLDGDRLYIQGKGRSEADAYIKLSYHVRYHLMKYLEHRSEALEHEPLFTSTSNRSRGKALSTRSISSIAKTAFIEAGIDSDRITAHSLRHSAATLNLLNGGTLEETQNLLRHSNINTTMVYLHHINRENNQSEQSISDVIFEGMTG